MRRARGSQALIFYLGSPEPCWLARTSVPLFLSRRRLSRYTEPPCALGLWALDSGAFSELALYGHHVTTPRQYVREVCRWLDRPGKLQWWAPQDWMCEPFMLEKTGMTVQDHQRRTIDNFLELCDLCPEFPPIPVLQGWTYEDYLRHRDQYVTRGIVLDALPLVGLGSVCRRQHTRAADEIIRAFSDLRIHAFGFKLSGIRQSGIRQSGTMLASADSMAWSLDARRAPPLPGCPHKSCANCMRYALRWREKAIAASRQGEQYYCPSLF